MIELKMPKKMVKNMVEKMNSQCQKKEKESDKLCNVEVQKLLSQCTLSHLPTNGDADDGGDYRDGVDSVVDGDDGVDDGDNGHMVMMVKALIKKPLSFPPIAPARSEEIFVTSIKVTS